MVDIIQLSTDTEQANDIAIAAIDADKKMINFKSISDMANFLKTENGPEQGFIIGEIEGDPMAKNIDCPHTDVVEFLRQTVSRKSRIVLYTANTLIAHTRLTTMDNIAFLPRKNAAPDEVINELILKPTERASLNGPIPGRFSNN